MRRRSSAAPLYDTAPALSVKEPATGCGGSQSRHGLMREITRAGEVLRLRARGLPVSLPGYRVLQGLSGTSPDRRPGKIVVSGP